MTSTSTTPLDIVLAYYQSWTGGDMDDAMGHIAEHIVCHAPAGRIDGAEAFRAFMGPFAQILTRAELLAAYGDEHAALLMYDTDTVAVKNAPAAEYHTVIDGKITSLRIIFDRTPFDAARRAAAG
jgi:ketosteroid isomerase-like protein